MSRQLVVLGSIAALVSCQTSTIEPDGSATEPQSRTLVSVVMTPPTAVDVLFVVDTNPSMADELDLVRERLSDFARALVVPEADENLPLRDLHLGVVATGGGGLFWLVNDVDHRADATDPDVVPIWEELSAHLEQVSIGTQNTRSLFISALDTLATSTEFLREDSLLSIIFVSDSDDKSTSLSVDEAFEALGNTRGRDGLPVTLAAIAGFPTYGSWSYGDSLDELRALGEIDEEGLRPSCAVDDVEAFLPIRLAELVYLARDDGALASICADDWSRVASLVNRRRGGSLLTPPCLQGALSGRCRVIFVPRAGERCWSQWQSDLGIDAAGVRHCLVQPADLDGDGRPDGDLQGWYGETHEGCEHGVLRLSDPWMYIEAGELRLECPGTS